MWVGHEFVDELGKGKEEGGGTGFSIHYENSIHTEADCFVVSFVDTRSVQFRHQKIYMITLHTNTSINTHTDRQTANQPDTTPTHFTDSQTTTDSTLPTTYLPYVGLSQYKAALALTFCA